LTIIHFANRPPPGTHAGGVSSLHSRGMVHRDIKPQNVLITCDDRLKLGDFGLASEKGSGGGVRVGTPAYLSPEVRPL
jgi:serine/threonine protein kinase